MIIAWGMGEVAEELVVVGGPFDYFEVIGELLLEL
jgi:hypothetical protein